MPNLQELDTLQKQNSSYLSQTVHMNKSKINDVHLKIFSDRICLSLPNKLCPETLIENNLFKTYAVNSIHSIQQL